MTKSMVAFIGVALASLATNVTMAATEADLTGTWTLDERSSDDPVRALRGRERGGGRGPRVGVSIFGVPVGGSSQSTSGDDRVEEEDEGEDEAEDDLVGVEHVFESTFRLRIEHDPATTTIRYGNEPVIAYTHGTRAEREGAVTSANWEDEVLVVEHQLADGTRVSERYWVKARSDELHWTVRLERSKASAVDIERVFYRARTAAP
jgi:hypothetical protein